MCVGVPAKVLEREAYQALVDVMGSQMKVGIIFVSDVKVGDYVIVHAGQAMTIIDEESAIDSLETWKEIIEARDAGEPVPIANDNPLVRR